MTEYFSSLTEAQYQKLKDAVPLITLLIGGADGELDQDELAWAEKVTKIRAYKMSEDLIGFYQDVGKDYAEKLDSYLISYPREPKARGAAISERLAELNSILAALDPRVAYHLYRSYKSFAKHVAKASGGFLGFFAINKEEAALIKLPMIEPIAQPEDYEEEE